MAATQQHAALKCFVTLGAAQIIIKLAGKVFVSLGGALQGTNPQIVSIATIYQQAGSHIRSSIITTVRHHCMAKWDSSFKSTLRFMNSLEAAFLQQVAKPNKTLGNLEVSCAATEGKNKNNNGDPPFGSCKEAREAPEPSKIAESLAALCSRNQKALCSRNQKEREPYPKRSHSTHRAELRNNFSA